MLLQRALSHSKCCHQRTLLCLWRMSERQVDHLSITAMLTCNRAKVDDMAGLAGLEAC